MPAIANFLNKLLIEDPQQKLDGFDLVRKECKMLNHFRSGHECSTNQTVRWNFANFPFCDCGDGSVVQLISHIVNDNGGYKCVTIVLEKQ